MRTSVTALSLLAGVALLPALAMAQDAPRVDKPVVSMTEPTSPVAASPVAASPVSASAKTDLEGPGLDLNAPSPVAANPKAAVKSASADDEFPAQVPAVKAAPRREATALPEDEKCKGVFLPVVGGNPSGVYTCD
jgi:hypothetical protein